MVEHNQAKIHILCIVVGSKPTALLVDLIFERHPLLISFGINMRALLYGLTLVSAVSSDLLNAIAKDDCSDETCSMSLLQVQASKIDSFLEHTAVTDCAQGMRKGNVCCASQCGRCGGRGCANRPGGAGACCRRGIRKRGQRCKRGDQTGCVTRQLTSQKQTFSTAIWGGRGQTLEMQLW